MHQDSYCHRQSHTRYFMMVLVVYTDVVVFAFQVICNDKNIEWFLIFLFKFDLIYCHFCHMGKVYRYYIP